MELEEAELAADLEAAAAELLVVSFFSAAAAPLGSALSKYLSKAALALPGGPKGVALVLSLLADLALWISLVAVDILLEVDTLLAVDCLLATDTELISEPEPNSLSSLILLSAFLVMFFNFPSKPLLFFFSPGRSSLLVDWRDSLDPVDRRSTLVSLSNLLMVMAL